MPSKTYSVRVSQSVDADSDALSGWINEVLSAGEVSLAPDPGPGPKTLRLSADAEKVTQGAKAAGENETVFLRRLIASRVRVVEEKEREKLRPKALVLPRELRVSAEQLEPLVAGFDGLQSFLLSRVVRAPEARTAARMLPDERADLSRTTASLVNRRCPQWLAENIDLLGAALQVASIESHVIARAYEASAERRKAAKKATEAKASAVPGAAPSAGGALSLEELNLVTEGAG